MMKSRVRPDERPFAWWVIALFAVTQASHGLGANAADTLFFLRFGVDELPRMILVSGIFVMVGLLVHGRRLVAAGARGWLWIAMVGCASWVVAEWVVVRAAVPGAYPIVWISTQVVIMVSFAAMWNAAGASSTTRQAKRLFPLFATAGVAGGVVGNLVTGPAATVLGAENLLLLQAGLLGLSAVVLVRLREHLGRDLTSGTADAENSGSTLDALRSSRLLRLGATAAFVMSVLWFLVIFPFSEAVTEAFGSEEDLASFLGLFSSIATALTFVVSLFVTNRIFARAGIVAALLTVPVLYAVGFGIWLAGFGLVSAVALRGAQWVVVNAIGATAYAALFNVFTGRRRGQVVSFLLAVPRQLGVVAAGALLIVSERLSRSVTFSIGLGSALVLLVVVVVMRRAYVDAVVTAVRRGLVGLFDVAQPGVVSVTDGDARRIIEARLEDERPEARAVAVTALARLGPIDAETTLAGMLDDPSPLVRATAFDALATLAPELSARLSSKALEDESPEVRLRAVRLVEAGEVESAPLRAAAMHDPDPRVRAEAAVRITPADGETVIRDLLDSKDWRTLRAALDAIARSGRVFGADLAAHLDHPRSEVRAAAASALAHVGNGHVRLVEALDDSSLPVRRNAALALAESAEGRAAMLQVLEHGSVNATDAALDALTPFDDATDLPIAEWARREAERATFLSTIARALDGDATGPTGLFLERVLRDRSERLATWVIRAVTTDSTRDVMAVVSRGVRSPDIETRAQAIEALESVSRGPAVAVLLPLLESEVDAEEPSSRDALRALCGDFDPWLRALATRCLAEEITADLDRLRAISRGDESDLVREAVPSFSIMQPEHMDSLDTMERVLALQRVEMFHALDPEDLELIASAATEQHKDAGEVVMRRGEKGEEMLIVVDGSVEIGTRDGGEVFRRGPGEPVGEMALLGSGLRSADVVAGPEGLHSLVLTKSDLLAVLAERPVVALGMLSTLAERLAEAGTRRPGAGR